LVQTVLQLHIGRLLLQTKDRPISSFETDIFKNKIHRYLASCRYSIGHQFRYSQICLPIFLPRYFNKAFWLKLVRIAYSRDLQQP